MAHPNAPPKEDVYCSQKLAWGTREEDHIRCWPNAEATLTSFKQWMEGIASWAEEGLT
jgi:hypothetical protein